MEKHDWALLTWRVVRRAGGSRRKWDCRQWQDEDPEAAGDAVSKEIEQTRQLHRRLDRPNSTNLALCNHPQSPLMTTAVACKPC